MHLKHKINFYKKICSVVDSNIKILNKVNTTLSSLFAAVSKLEIILDNLE